MMQPIDYAGPQTIQPKRSRGLFGWVVFIALAVLMFMVVNKSNTERPLVPFSSFQGALVSGKLQSVTISGDEIFGEFKTPQRVAGNPAPVQKFKTVVPTGMGASWGFMEWMLDHRQGADIVVENNQNLLLKVLVPLIPWLLIFGLIWFFVFRQTRNRLALEQFRSMRSPVREET